MVPARNGAISQTFVHAHAYEETDVKTHRRTDTLHSGFERHSIKVSSKLAWPAQQEDIRHTQSITPEINRFIKKL